MQKLKILLLSLLFAVPLVVPVLAQAQSGIPISGSSGGDVTTGLDQVQGSSSTFQGKLSQQTSISAIIILVIKIILALSGMVAVLAIIIAGFRLVTSNGNEQTAEKAKKTLLYAVIGLAVIILSYVIVNVLVNELTS